MKLAAWRCIGASVTGVSHQRKEQPCQDYWRHCTLPTGELVVAVADGAGSARMAQAGAHLVVESALAAVQALRQRYQPTSRKAWRDLVARAFGAAQRTVARHAEQTGYSPRDYAATLVLALITPELVVCGLIGDCAIVVATAEGELQSLCQPQRGLYANTTYFATHHSHQERLDLQLWEGAVSRVALFSDGLLSLAMNIEQNQPYTPFFTPLFAFAAEATDSVEAGQALATFLASERVNQRTHDDKTLVLVTRTVSDQ